MLKHAYELGAAQAVKEANSLVGAALGAGAGGLAGYAKPEWFGEDLSRGGGALRGALGGGVAGGLLGTSWGLLQKGKRVPSTPDLPRLPRPPVEPGIGDALLDIQRRTKLSPEAEARVAARDAWEALPLEEKLRHRTEETYERLAKDRGNRNKIHSPEEIDRMLKEIDATRRDSLLDNALEIFE